MGLSASYLWPHQLNVTEGDGLRGVSQCLDKCDWHQTHGLQLSLRQDEATHPCALPLEYLVIIVMTKL